MQVQQGLGESDLDSAKSGSKFVESPWTCLGRCKSLWRKGDRKKWGITQEGVHRL
jgi:hypothetical protein